MAPHDLPTLRLRLLGITLPLALALPVASSAAAPRRRAPKRGKVGPRHKSKWPKPLVTRHYLEVKLRYDRGKLRQQSLLRKSFKKRKLIKRIVGRFLAKLYRGKRLKDVIPFNFPLLAPAENFTRTGHRIARRIEANLRTGTVVKLPWLRGLTRVTITDVATGRRWALDLSPLHKKKPRRRAR